MNENENQNRLRGPFTAPPLWLVILWAALFLVTAFPSEDPASPGAYLFAGQYSRAAMFGAAIGGWVLGTAWTRRRLRD